MLALTTMGNFYRVRVPMRKPNAYGRIESGQGSNCIYTEGAAANWPGQAGVPLRHPIFKAHDPRRGSDACQLFAGLTDGTAAA